jgi:tetratricopeptide (TPR) repeat protein
MFRQWEQAEQEWLKALNTVAGREKGRIFYNLALAREREGDYTKALEYITEAEKLFPSAEVKAYKRTLEREKEKREK